MDIINGHTLYNGNNTPILDKLITDGIKVDSIITDPPYGMNFRSNHRGKKYKNIENDHSLYWLGWFTKQCYDIAKDNSGHFIFCSYHNIDIFKQSFERYFEIKNILVWEKNKTSMGDLKGNFAPKVEFILFITKGRPLLRGSRSPNIFKYAGTQNKLHPTQKPVPLMEHLISKMTDKGDLILDPFMGSGSTILAADNLGRKSIGIELDADYYKTAKDRLENNVSFLD